MADQVSRPIPFTANPVLLMLNDMMLFVQITFLAWPITAGLPSIILPIIPTRSGPLDELAITGPNLWASALHGLLVVTQVVFLVSLVPLAFLVLPTFYFLYVIAFVVGNQWFTVLLNGPRRKGLFRSNPQCTRGQPTHEHERWVFINGVAVGNHWLQSNLDRLAMTFRRPVYGIHNQTRGIIFDVLECIIQRDLSFATLDIRQAYAALVNILAQDDVHKVVLILHSQGAIEGGLVLDWLYATVAAPQLSKLEVYTFGNAANHWNAPVISTAAASDGTKHSSTTTTTSPEAEERIVTHIEHYANEGDYVSRFGILHFRPDQAAEHPTPPTPGPTTPGGAAPPSANMNNQPQQRSSTAPSPVAPRIVTATARSATWSSLSPKTPIERINPDAQEHNRFFGRLFKRAGSGHQLNQHYLDNVFEMEGLDANDFSKGRVRDGNVFMDAEVDMDVYRDWNTVQVVAGVPNGGRATRTSPAKKQVKELSRLWAYRNGGKPLD